MGYMVCEDLVGATEIKIHKEECRFAKNRKEGAETMAWHGPIDYNDAKNLAEKLSANYKKSWKNAECCIG